MYLKKIAEKEQVNDYSEYYLREMDNIAQEYRELFNESSKRIVMITSGEFLDTVELTNNLLHLKYGKNNNVIALKGLEGVFVEFDKKLIGVSRELLIEHGLQMPKNGIADLVDDLGYSKEDAEQLTSKIRKNIFSSEIINSYNDFENKKLVVLKGQNAQKKKIAEDKAEIYANWHIWDLALLNKQTGERRVVKTYNKFPVITDEWATVGIGPLTENGGVDGDKVYPGWAKIISTADLVIFVGANVLPYKNVLAGISDNVIEKHITP